jgi:putative oxidoreductase
MKIISLIARIIAAFIMSQTLYFKFTGAAESVYIFSKIGMEPVGRIGTGVGELIASALLLIPATCWVGAILAIVLMSGAIFFHLTILGVEIMNDGGQLFYYGISVMACAVIILLIHRKSVRKFVNLRLIRKDI